MQFASYAAFRQTLQSIIDGDDTSQSSLSTEMLDTMTAAGEQRLYRDVKSTLQDATMSMTITSNTAALPSDCIELKSVVVSTGRPLKYLPYEDIEARLQLNSTFDDDVDSGSDTSIFYSLQGDSVIFWPLLPDGTVMGGRYRKRFNDIAVSDITGNTFFARWPDLWLFAALAESAPIIGDDNRIPVWESKYLQVAQQVKLQESRRGTMGSKLQTRIVR